MVRKRSVLGLLVALALPLASCSGSFGETLERSLSADPELQNNPNLLGGGGNPAAAACDGATLAQLPDALPRELCYPNGTVLEVIGAATAGADAAGTTESEATDASEAEADPTESDLTEADATEADPTEADLTEADLTEADLTDSNATESDAIGSDDPGVATPGAIAIQWATADDLDQVWTFYEAQLEAAGWELAQRPVRATDGDANGEAGGDTDGSDSARLEAVKAGVRVTVSPQPVADFPAADAATADDGGDRASDTLFEVSYRPGESDRTLSPVSIPNGDAPNGGSDAATDPASDRPDGGGVAVEESADVATPADGATDFADLTAAPAELRPYLQDLAQLGVLTAVEEGDRPNFQPNATVTRRDFARWLFTANNTLHRDRSSRRIRPATNAAQPVFQDVPASDPDFEIIQGLAEAGLVPSPLSGASTTVTFRPDAPLTREDLLLWKVPLDLRQSLPNATVEAVQQTWGFQDAARIDPKALQAVLADYQNADQSNIRRAFGYTTLLQPQKAVTRAEAAATLWFFGYQGDGISAAQVAAPEEAEPAATSDPTT